MVKAEKTESKFFKGQTAYENGITEIIFVTEPDYVEATFTVDGKDKTTKRLEGEINYEGYSEGKPNVLSLNDTSANILIDVLGDDTKQWMGKKIPINASLGNNKKYQLLVDGVRLKKIVEVPPTQESL